MTFAVMFRRRNLIALLFRLSQTGIPIRVPCRRR
jgi:hypothetical protein